MLDTINIMYYTRQLSDNYYLKFGELQTSMMEIESFSAHAETDSNYHISH